jgi:hypothetical protein
LPWREELAPTTHFFVADFHFFPLRAAFRTSGRHVFVSTSYINTGKGLLQGIGVVRRRYFGALDFGFWMFVERGGVIFLSAFMRRYAPFGAFMRLTGNVAKRSQTNSVGVTYL